MQRKRTDLQWERCDPYLQQRILLIQSLVKFVFESCFGKPVVGQWIELQQRKSALRR
jgi:hypothetical protein